VGLRILGIWIGYGRTLFRTNLLGYNTEFKILPVGGLTFFTHTLEDKLRFRYFLAVLAGPASNATILAIAWQFVSWRTLNIETSIEFGAMILFGQVFILVENLLPYRIRTAVGTICSDGLSLLQLSLFKSPDALKLQPNHYVMGNTQTGSSGDYPD